MCFFFHNSASIKITITIYSLTRNEPCAFWEATLNEPMAKQLNEPKDLMPIHQQMFCQYILRV